MYEIVHYSDRTEICGLDNFSLDRIFDCGQCFRFDKKEGMWCGVAFGKYLKAYQKDETTIVLYCKTEDIPVWCEFFCLDEDYKDIISTFPSDPIIADALNTGKGIRILRQDKWEALCSFIISQNNNIPRIKKLISALCEKYGTEIKVGSDTFYSFPSASVLAGASEDDLYALKLGFRAPYILSAAKAVESNEVSLETVSSLPADKASLALESIKGVGPKVAACTLLFGFHMTGAFPIDVWVKKILEKYFPHLPHPMAGEYFGKYAGIAQQYLFYHERYVVSESESKASKM